VGHHAEVALAHTGFVGPTEQGAAEPALVSAESTLGLPPLAEHPLVPVTFLARAEVPGHLTAVPAMRRCVVAARVDRDHRRADPQILPRLSVVNFGVECGVRQHPVPNDQQGRQEQDRGELRGVVGRAGGDGGPGDEVRVGVDGGGQLGPGAGRVLALGARNEVPRGVAAVEPGGIDGDGRLLGDQFGLECGRDGAFEEVDEAPPFRSRPSA
jgi:hypothetical protein